HAEAEDGKNMRDIDRALTIKGQKAARLMGEKHVSPPIVDSIYVSPARRTQETARILCVAFGFKTESLQLQPLIYSGSLQQQLALLQKVDETVKRLLWIGHNPNITELANQLSKKPIVSHMATAGIVELNFNVDSWLELDWNIADFLLYDAPECHVQNTNT
ncbi:MAG: histidine phosphatase family protein, partial [Pseudomonadota bacterium]